MHEIINERSSQYFSSSQIENELKKRTVDLNLVFNKYQEEYKNLNKKNKGKRVINRGVSNSR